ncbi:hypothetical protein U1Q18_027362 [Sarracenia purpurea var. burkii]
MTLNVHGKKVLVTPLDVHNIFGMPCDGVVVPIKGPLEAIRELCQGFDTSKDGSIPLKQLKEKLVATEDADDSFQRRLLLYLLRALLCLNTELTVNRRYLHSMVDVSSIRHYNWSQLVIEFLVHDIRQYKDKGQRGIKGCRLFLMPTPSIRDWDDDQISIWEKVLQAMRYEENIEVSLADDVI